MTIERKTGRDRYKTKTFGSITDQTMLSTAFGGIIRTLAEGAYSIRLPSIAWRSIGCITYGRLEIDACRVEPSVPLKPETIITSLSSIEEEHVI